MANLKITSPATKRAAAINRTPTPNFRPRNSGAINATSKTGTLAGDIRAAIPPANKPARQGVRKSLYVNK